MVVHQLHVGYGFLSSALVIRSNAFDNLAYGSECSCKSDHGDKQEFDPVEHIKSLTECGDGEEDANATCDEGDEAQDDNRQHLHVQKNYHNREEKHRK